MKRLRVEVAPAYPVLIGRGALARISPSPGRFAVVVDEHVDRLHGERIRAHLAPFRCEFTTLPSGEAHKTLRTAETLYDWLAERRFERHEPVVAIGGGVTGDVAGFAAATWRRGVPLVQVPTTLLAHVDSSVGGKVAVDHPSGKNLIGCFHQPREVLADTAFLESLPLRERRAGLAEIVKTALLAGDSLLDLVRSGYDALERLEDPLEEVIADCIAFKAAVVQRDPLEHGERAILNLGHTVGHALEQVTGYGTLLHGEAVAYGLRAALELSGFSRTSPERRLVDRIALPPLPRVDPEALLEAMKADKKVEGGRVRFVLLDAPGRPRRGCDVPPERVREVLDALLAGEL